MKTIVLIRHAERMKEASPVSGDAPISEAGRARIVQTMRENVVPTLERYGIKEIDLAIVSGSTRCCETFAEAWRELLAASIQINRVEIRREFYSTPEEDEEWARLWTDGLEDYLRDESAYGEKAAVLKHAGSIVEACVDRILSLVNESDRWVTMVVTHGPHDARLAERLTGVAHKGLVKGEGLVFSAY